MYSITDFDRHYITGDMKRRNVKRPSWFKCPTDSPEVLNLIHGHPNGLSHLGCWNRLQGWAVMNWHSDGAFVTAEGEMSVEQISIHIGLYGFNELLQEAITRLVAIGWMNESQYNHEAIAGDSRLHYITLHDKTEEENTEKEESSSIRWLKTKGWVGPVEDHVDGWGEAYPSVCVRSELKRMSEWLKANPAKARKRQWLRFITNWLARSQESTAPRATSPTVSSSWAEEAAP